MESSSPTELKQVADCIFRKPPAPPKTIVLQLTEESSNQFVNDPNASPELEFFTDMARYGVAILFGENCNIANLSRDQFALLQKYMNSMGVALCIKCNADSCDPWDLVEAGGSIEYLRVSVDFI